MSWAAQFVDVMLEHKRAGASFEKAFAVAQARHGIAARELGGGFVDETDLYGFARGQKARQGSVDWWRGVCWAAWSNAPQSSGEPSRLYLLPGLVAYMDAADESRPARHVHGVRGYSGHAA